MKKDKVKVVVLYCSDPIISFNIKEVVKQNKISLKKATIFIDMENGLIIIHNGNPSMNQEYFKSIYKEVADIDIDNVSKLRLNVSKETMNLDIVFINEDNNEED